MIVQRDGKKAMESQVIHRQRPSAWNMLVTGSEDWEDYQLEADLRMLNTSLLSGLAFRYQNSRCFYAFCFEDQKVKLIKRNQEECVELACENFEYNCDTVYRLKIVCKGDRLDAYIFTCSDCGYRYGWKK